MSQHSPEDTAVLPSNYQRHLTVDFKRDRKIVIVIQGIFLTVVIVAVVVALFVQLPPAQDDQLRRGHQELRSRRATIRQDLPAWVKHLPPHDHPGYEDSLNKVLLWPAVADYDQAGHPHGPELDQPMSTALRAYYQQARQALTPAVAHKPGQQAHNELVAEHPDQVSQLNDEPMDFSLLDEVFDAEHQATSVEEQTIAARQYQQPALEVDWSTFDFD